jgi:hypothetical protein
MNYLFKPLTILLALFWCITLVAQDSQMDRSPNSYLKNPNNNIEAMWDVLLQFDAVALTGAAGNAGCEWDGTYFYSTRWASNLLHKYDATGTTMIEQFSIPGVTGLRDLAFDGTYMYGGAAANTIYQMDFVTKTLIGTISSPVAVRFIAYDEANDAFWCGNWTDPPTLVNRAGTAIASFTTGFAAQYGAAYDNVSPGGPFLWIFNQENTTGGIPQTISQWDIATGTATGVTHDVMIDVGILAGNLSIAGGLFSMTDYASGFFTIGGLLQGNPLGALKGCPEYRSKQKPRTYGEWETKPRLDEGKAGKKEFARTTCYRSMNVRVVLRNNNQVHSQLKVKFQTKVKNQDVGQRDGYFRVEI